MSISKILGFLVISALLISSVVAQSPAKAPVIRGGRRVISPVSSPSDSPSIDTPAALTPSLISDSPAQAPGPVVGSAVSNRYAVFGGSVAVLLSAAVFAISNFTRNAESSLFYKAYTADTAIGDSLLEDSEEKDDLRSRIFRLRLPKRSAATVLEKWVGEGNQITVNELREISRELRRTQRYKHALEITEWLVQHEEFKISDADYASRIDLISKVFGIDAAERYFEGLHKDSKTTETYTSLLHAFAGSKRTERAEALFKRIIETDSLTFGAITYNEMMTLYMSVGHVEKVSEVIEVLKHKKVSPDIFTYNLWLSSCAATFNIDELRKILEEMRRDGGFNEDWARYADLTSIYVNSSRLANA